MLGAPSMLQVLSVTSCYGMPYLMFHVHSHKLDKMTGAWLLPVVSAARRKHRHRGVVLVLTASMAVPSERTHRALHAALVQQPAQHKPQHCQGCVCGL